MMGFIGATSGLDIQPSWTTSPPEMKPQPLELLQSASAKAQEALELKKDKIKKELETYGNKGIKQL